MKKQVMAVLAMLMILVTLGSVYAEETAEIVGQPGEFDQYVAQESGKLLLQDIYKPSFFERLFSGGQAFSFVDAEVDDLSDYSCTLTSTSGSYNHNPGHNGLTGGTCGTGKFIVFKSDGGDLPAGTVLFDNLWYRSAQSDLPNFHNYYLDDLSFQYSYACYTCNVEDTSSSEPGCLTENENACVAQDHPQCDVWYGYESVCLQHIDDGSSSGGSGGGSAGEDAIDIELAQSNKQQYQVGEIIEIVGYADINDDVNNAVIETSLTYVDYVDYQPLSVTATSQLDKGVCGDDITTGVKFNADEGDEVAFKLRMTAKEPGEYRIKVVAATGCGQGITDEYTVSKFKIVPASNPVDVDDDEPGTVQDDDESEDLGKVIDWSDFVGGEDESCENCNGGNDVKKVINTPVAKFTEQYLDYDNNPTTAYSVTAVALLILALIGYIVYQLWIKK